MRTYLRVRIKGGCYFFTINLAERQGNDLLIRNIENLRAAFLETRRDHPFGNMPFGMMGSIKNISIISTTIPSNMAM